MAPLYGRLTCDPWHETVESKLETCDHPPRRLRSWMAEGVVVVACQGCGQMLTGDWKLRPGGDPPRRLLEDLALEIPPWVNGGKHGV